MSFKSFRDKASRAALICAVVLFAVDWLCRVSFWHINQRGWGETTTPPGVAPVWFLLWMTTLVLGLITLPRWQSLLALLCVGWVGLMTLQGHWPGV